MDCLDSNCLASHTFNLLAILVKDSAELALVKQKVTLVKRLVASGRFVTKSIGGSKASKFVFGGAISVWRMTIF